MLTCFSSLTRDEHDVLTLTTIRGAGVVFFLIKWFIKLFVFYELDISICLTNIQ